jgi:hypothetical protein
MAEAWPSKRQQCRGCHTIRDSDAAIFTFLDGAATTSINMPNDGTGSFEIDYYFTNATEAGSFEGVGVHILVPKDWQVTDGTGAFSPPGWDPAWDLASQGTWLGPHLGDSPFAGTPDGYTVNYDGTVWDTGAKDSACDQGGNCGFGTDADTIADRMGTDTVIIVPNGTPAGVYNVRVMGIGHDGGTKSYVEDIITVTVSSDVTLAVAEISPNAVAASSAGNIFTYDMDVTISGLATGFDEAAITAPVGYTNLAVNTVTVGGAPFVRNCPVPGANQFCEDVTGQVMTITLGALEAASTTVQVVFTADAPSTLGSDVFSSTVDNTGTLFPPEQAVEGNADGDSFDLNNQVVTVTGTTIALSTAPTTVSRRS